MANNRNPHQRLHYRELSAITDRAVQEFAQYMQYLSDAHLGQAETLIRSLDSGNCGWTIYHMKGLLSELMRDERLRRRKESTGDAENE